jgi:uncharacterized protein YebE (UPF0316 family)
MFWICIRIFLARIIDVTIGTVRTVLTVKGRTLLPVILAFFEVFIWFWVAREALNTSINSLAIPFFYSLGYASGTFLGTVLCNNFLKGFIGIQIITNSNNEMVDKLRKAGFGVSVCGLKKNIKEKKDMLFIQIKREKLSDVTCIVRKIDKNAFVTISETKYVQNGLIK